MQIFRLTGKVYPFLVTSHTRCHCRWITNAENEFSEALKCVNGGSQA